MFLDDVRAISHLFSGNAGKCSCLAQAPQSAKSYTLAYLGVCLIRGHANLRISVCAAHSRLMLVFPFSCPYYVGNAFFCDVVSLRLFVRLPCKSQCSAFDNTNVSRVPVRPATGNPLQHKRHYSLCPAKRAVVSNSLFLPVSTMSGGVGSSKNPGFL